MVFGMVSLRQRFIRVVDCISSKSVILYDRPIASFAVVMISVIAVMDIALYLHGHRCAE